MPAGRLCLPAAIPGSTTNPCGGAIILRMLRPYRSILPRIHPTAFIDDSAQVIGDVEIGEGTIVGAGSLVLEHMKVPPRSLVVGRPAVKRRDLTEAEVGAIRASADRYVGYREDYQ